MSVGVEECEITHEYLRGIKHAYRTIIDIINENPLLSKNDIRLIIERQLRIEEND